MHLESLLLHLMTSEDGEQFVLAKKRLYWLLSEVVRAVTLWILLEFTMHGFLIIHRVSPEQITENTVQRNLLETVY